MTEAFADCELCNEVLLAGTGATGPDPTVDRIAFSRLIMRTSNADVIAGLGCLIPGYVVLVPARHVDSIGELDRREVEEIFDLAWATVGRVRRTFGGSAVTVEHGSSGPTNSTGRACIAHAHMHIFPISAAADAQAFQLEGSIPVHSLELLVDAANSGRNYYYAASSWADALLKLDPRIPSQHARRVWVTGLRPTGTNGIWAVLPNFENARLTATALRSALDEALSNDLTVRQTSSLGETIRAYDESAAEYAASTRLFTEPSSLKAELVSLAAQTNGVVLDAGAGAGRDSLFTASLGRQVIALDASRMLLSTWTSLQVAQVVGDIRRIPLPTESVGAVWCSAVLLHLAPRDALRALREFHRVLVDGGLAQVSVKEGRGYVSQPMSTNPAVRRHFFYYEVGDLAE